MEDRINWSDEQWAEHLGIPVTQLFYTRNSIKEQYAVDIVRNDQNKNIFTVALYQIRTSPSGFTTRQCIATAPKEHSDSVAARNYANKEFLPALEMSDTWVKTTHLPKRALQLLSVMER